MSSVVGRAYPDLVRPLLVIGMFVVACNQPSRTTRCDDADVAIVATPSSTASATAPRFTFHGSCNVSLANSGGYVKVSALVTETNDGKDPADYIWDVLCDSLDGRWRCFGSRLAVDSFEKGEVYGLHVTNFEQADMHASVTKTGVVIRALTKLADFAGGGYEEYARLTLTPAAGNSAGKMNDTLRVSHRQDRLTTTTGTTACLDALDWN